MSSQLNLTAEERQALAGVEILVLERDERVRQGFVRLLGNVDIMVTATPEADRALKLAAEKFFPVIVVDMDTPEPAGGIDLIAQFKQRSAASAMILLSEEESFDLAVRGFRAGAADVVAKAPTSVRYLIRTVVRLCLRQFRNDSKTRLMSRVLDAHEQFLKRLIDASRRATMAEEQLTGGHADDRENFGDCVVLVVDDNPRNGPGLERALAQTPGFKVVTALNSGEALDFVGQHKFHIAVVKEGLPDLPSGMVVKSLKAEVPDGIVLRFTPPGSRPGRVELIEHSQAMVLIADLTHGTQLVQQMIELREAYWAKTRERRYLKVFRRNHYDFLKNYVELRQELMRIVSPDGTDSAASSELLDNL